MSNIEEELKEFEEKRKNELYGFCKIITSKQASLIEVIKKHEQKLGVKNGIIPNIGITFNNKIVEISQIFQKSGISMFASIMMNYGEKKGKTVTHSFVGQAVLGCLIDNIDKGISTLEQYNSKLIELLREKYKPLQYNSKFRFLSSIMLKIKLLTGKIKREQFDLTKEEINELGNILLEYKNIETEMWNYNLKGNIVENIMNCLKQIEYSDLTVLRIEDECIIPDMTKLGLIDLIPEIKDRIEEYMRANQQSWELSPEEKEKLKESMKEYGENKEQNSQESDTNKKQTNEENNQGR